MRTKNPSFRGLFWSLGLFLALPTFSVKAGELGSFLRYAAIFNRSGSSGEPARITQGHRAKGISAQNANGWPVVTRNVVLALPASGRTEALIDTKSRQCLANASCPFSSEAIPHSFSDTGAVPIHFELADSLIYMQASINGSQPLWMMLDTGSSFTVFDESVSKMLGIRFLEGRK